MRLRVVEQWRMWSGKRFDATVALCLDKLLPVPVGWLIGSQVTLIPNPGGLFETADPVRCIVSDIDGTRREIDGEFMEITLKPMDGYRLSGAERFKMEEAARGGFDAPRFCYVWPDVLVPHSILETSPIEVVDPAARVLAERERASS